MRSLHRIGSVLLILAVVAWLPSGSSAELAPWDQERVTALAGEFSAACDALYDTFVKEPVQGRGSANARDYYQLRRVIRRLKGRANHHPFICDALGGG